MKTMMMTMLMMTTPIDDDDDDDEEEEEEEEHYCYADDVDANCSRYEKDSRGFSFFSNSPVCHMRFFHTVPVVHK